MKVIIQRVSKACVSVDNTLISSINGGLLLLLGICNEDSFKDIEWLSKKILNMRIFNDKDKIMNKSLLDINGEIIVISQFTLMGSTKKGNRPSYIKAAKPDVAIPLYEQFISHLEKEFGKKIGTGIFGADMKVELINDGPVTISLNSLNKE